MNHAATIDPARPQYMDALARANRVRLARADLKRRVATGQVSAAEVILDVPEEAETMEVFDLLASQRRWGTTRCRKFLQSVSLMENKTIGTLTERQRCAVATRLAVQQSAGPNRPSGRESGLALVGATA